MHENLDIRRCFVGGKHPFGLVHTNRIGQRVLVLKIRQIKRADKGIKGLDVRDRKSTKQDRAITGKLRGNCLVPLTYPAIHLIGRHTRAIDHKRKHTVVDRLLLVDVE